MIRAVLTYLLTIKNSRSEDKPNMFCPHHKLTPTASIQHFEMLYIALRGFPKYVRVKRLRYGICKTVLSTCLYTAEIEQIICSILYNVILL